MARAGYVLAIDQGTTSSRAIVFDEKMGVKGEGRGVFRTWRSGGRVEQDAVELRSSVEEASAGALASSGVEAKDLAGVGIANQRETFVLWEKATGLPVHRAIVWQDRRAEGLCKGWKGEGLEGLVRERTGLVLDSYFTGPKLSWLMGEGGFRGVGGLLWGTVDSWLIWSMTGGGSHVTDATNASRTMLYDIKRGDWDEELFGLLGIERGMEAEVRDNAGDFGVVKGGVLDGVRILGAAGDQQASAMGHGCFEPGRAKATYGTGCFVLWSMGGEMKRSEGGLLTTIGGRLGGRTWYAQEGSIYACGSILEWLTRLGALGSPRDADAMAARAKRGEDGAILVPAFTGLGAPYWDSECRGAVYGLTLGTGREELALAALEAIGRQTADLLTSAELEGVRVEKLRVDGGVSGSDYAMRAVADYSGVVVERAQSSEVTALGVGWLAGLAAGIYPGIGEVGDFLGAGRRFEPMLGDEERERGRRIWREAVDRTRRRG